MKVEKIMPKYLMAIALLGSLMSAAVVASMATEPPAFAEPAGN